MTAPLLEDLLNGERLSPVEDGLVRFLAIISISHGFSVLFESSHLDRAEGGRAEDLLGERPQPLAQAPRVGS
jgi:hypothetical protein